MIYKLYKDYKNSETLDEKIIFWLIIFIFLFPLILYYLDRYNIPSVFKWINNAESNKWFEFITTYFSSIIGAIIGAVVLILMTIHEFENQNRVSREERRINNLPFIRYNFDVYNNYNATIFQELKGINGKTNNIFLKIQLKNIGMNTIRKCYINLDSELVKDNYDYMIDEQEMIEKDKEKNIVFKVPVFKKSNTLKITIKYQDILFNWYKQVVFLNIYNVIFNDDHVFNGNITKSVFDEELLDKNPELNIKKIKQMLVYEENKLENILYKRVIVILYIFHNHELTDKIY